MRNIYRQVGVVSFVVGFVVASLATQAYYYMLWRSENLERRSRLVERLDRFTRCFPVTSSKQEEFGTLWLQYMDRIGKENQELEKLDKMFREASTLSGCIPDVSGITNSTSLQSMFVNCLAVSDNCVPTPEDVKKWWVVRHEVEHVLHLIGDEE